jgi:dephospho-CoA kinase
LKGLSIVQVRSNAEGAEVFAKGAEESLMLRVGLTGSIAVGKSFVLRVLAELGCRIIDADAVARQVVLPGSPGLKAVIEAFGEEILESDGSLDRGRLGEIVFADEAKRQQLNSILHPFIIAAQDAQLREWEQNDPKGIAVVDAALMIESGGYRRFDKLIVVHCRPEVQLQRLMRRNQLSRGAAEQRIATQMSQEEKMSYADYLIDTSEEFAKTRRQTEEVYGALRETSAKESSSPRHEEDSESV